MSAPSYSQSDYLVALQALLPRGPAWPRDPDAVLTQVLQGLAANLASTNTSANNLLVDAFPATVDDMLPEWNETLGLPGLTGYTGDDLATQQAQVVAALTDSGGQSAAYFVALAATLGFPIAINGYRPYRVSDHVNDPISGAGWAHVWRVNVLSGADYTVLETLFDLYKPAHTTVLFVSQPPTASFSASPVPGAAPLAVAFTDSSTGNPTAWLWTFGDGATSTVQNPTHTYESSGIYTVELQATIGGISYSCTKANYINTNADEYFSDVVLLLHGNGANGGTVFTDSSSLAHVPASTVGSPVTSTAQFEFGSSSIYFPQTFDNEQTSIHYAASNSWEFGAGPFTIEALVYPVSPVEHNTQYTIIAASWDGSGSGWLFALQWSGGVYHLCFFFNGGGFSQVTTSTVPLNQWSTVAVTRSGSTMDVYINGVSQSSGTGSSIIGETDVIGYSTNGMSIGSTSDGSTPVNETYLQEIRITKADRYGGVSYTPAVAPFPNY